MNFFLGLVLLLGAIAIFVYEGVTGNTRFRIQALGISNGWLLLLLALYNFARWYSARMSRSEAQARRYVDEARLRQAQRRERPEPDPAFDFTNQPRHRHRLRRQATDFSLVKGFAIRDTEYGSAVSLPR